MVEETILLEEIWRNNIKEVKELENNNEQAWEEEKIVYMKGRIYVYNMVALR